MQTFARFHSSQPQWFGANASHARGPYGIYTQRLHRGSDCIKHSRKNVVSCRKSGCKHSASSSHKGEAKLSHLNSMNDMSDDGSLSEFISVCEVICLCPLSTHARSISLIISVTTSGTLRGLVTSPSTLRPQSPPRQARQYPAFQ